MALSDLWSVSGTLLYMNLWALLLETQADDCVSPVRWERLDPPFLYISLTNDCNPPRLGVFTTTYNVNHSTFHVAAFLCSHSRYKLLLKDTNNYNDIYWDIVVSHGNGADHCELVGADIQGRSSINVSLPNMTYFNHGYYRGGWGETFKEGKLADSKTPGWYECGVAIPSSKVTHGCGKKAKKEEEESNLSQGGTAGTIVGVIVGSIIGSCLCLIAVIFMKSKLCPWSEPDNEEEAPCHEPPARLPPASTLRSAMTHGTQGHTQTLLPHQGPSRPSPTTLRSQQQSFTPTASRASPSAPLVPPLEAPLAAPLAALLAGLPTAPTAPLAPPPEPPWGVSAPSAPSLTTGEEGAPPTYEEAENYPLVRAAEVVPPPYKDLDSV